MKRYLVAVVLLVACQSTVKQTVATPPSTSVVVSTSSNSTATSVAPSTTPASSVAPSTAVPGGADYTPPPGALNPAVTQATIGSTICVPGWTATVRPPVSYTNALKLKQLAARHMPETPAQVEEDHFVPLELGGAPRDPLNLWPEPRVGPHASSAAKDHAENTLKAKVCAGQVTLQNARYEIIDPATWGKL